MTGTVICLDCNRPTPATQHGACGICGSEAVRRATPYRFKKETK